MKYRAKIEVSLKISYCFLKGKRAICNREGNIFGLMPHAERAMYWWQQPDWTQQQQMMQYGDGKLIFQSIIDKLVENC